MKKWNFHTVDSVDTYVSIEARYKSGLTTDGTTDPQAAFRRNSLRAPLTTYLTTVIVAVTLLTGCSASDDRKQSPTSATASPSTGPGLDAASSDAASWDTAGHGAAQAAGMKILRTWSHPQMAYEAWWAGLGPLLSPEARDVYAYTDPANIPALTITGKGIETNNDNPFVVTITFPTTKGKFGVDLSRTSIPGRWIGESIIFPGETSKLQG